MECFLEHLDAARFVLGILVILEACTDVLGFYQHGASVHTRPLNLNVSKGSGKSLQKQVMITSARYLAQMLGYSYLIISLQTVIAVRINYSQWFKSQKAKKPSRILPPPLPSSLVPCGNQAKHQSSTSEKLEDLKVSMVGLPKESMVTFEQSIPVLMAVL